LACAHRPPKPWPGSPRASGSEGHFSARDFGDLFRNTGRPSESPPLCAQGASALGHVLTSTDSSINRCDLLEGRWRLRHTSRGNGGRGCPTAGKWWCDDMVSTGSSAAVGPQRRARTSTLPWHGRSELITRAAHNYTSSITPPGFEAWRTDSIRTPSRHIPRQIAQGNPAGDAPWFRQFGSSVCPLTVTALRIGNGLSAAQTRPRLADGGPILQHPVDRCALARLESVHDRPVGANLEHPQSLSLPHCHFLHSRGYAGSCEQADPRSGDRACRVAGVRDCGYSIALAWPDGDSPGAELGRLTLWRSYKAE
jgi:hypothetical protein